MAQTSLHICAAIHCSYTPNKFLDSHPNFVKNWIRCKVKLFIFFIFPTALMSRKVMKETFNTLNLNCQNE